MSLQRKLAEMFNVTPEIDFLGVKYEIKLATIKQRAEFATWVEQRAWDYIRRLELTDETGERKKELRDMRTDLVGEVAAGQYEWGGEPVLKAIGTRTGQAYILYILLKDSHPEVTEDFAKTMLDERYKEINERIMRAIDDPKVLSELLHSVAILKSSDG